MLALKRWIAVVVLAAVALWPGIHFALYRTYGIDAWKLCGWAMYARPHAQWQLGLFELLDGDRERGLTVDSPAVTAEIARLGRRRGAFGELQSMDSLGRLLLSTRADLAAVRIRLRKVDFDCASARVDRLRHYSYDYRR